MEKDFQIEQLKIENLKLKADLDKLHNREGLYKRLFEASPDIIIEVDKNRLIIICHIPNYSKEILNGLIGKNIFDVTPVIFHTQMKLALDKVFYSGEIATYNSEGETIGAYRYYSNHLSPIYNENKEITSAYFISREVTQQKIAEKLIIESEKKLKAIFDSSKHLHILLGTDTCCLWFNKKASLVTEMVFGKKLEIGKYDIDCIPEELLTSFRLFFQKCLNGETVTYEREYFISNNENNNLEITLQPVFSELDNKIIGVSMIGIDITDRHNYEENLKKINKELVQQNSQLNQYSHIISHNLRGPIVTLLGLTEIFENYKEDVKLQNDVIAHIKKSSIHLDNIIKDLNQILTLTENIELSKTEVSFEEEISILKDLLKSQIENAQASFELNISEAPSILSVKSYIQSILLNLTTNSLKYKNKETPAIIKIKTSTKDSILCLSFADNGLGFDLESNKDKLFGFYKRFHTHVEGKGLGLYLLKKQLETLGGTIEVESEINVGTTFRLYLPI